MAGTVGFANRPSQPPTVSFGRPDAAESGICRDGDLYHTVDDGRHWKKVAIDGPTVADPGFTALAVLGNQVLVAGPSGIVSGGVTNTWAADTIEDGSERRANCWR
jgi:hypothetical protein